MYAFELVPNMPEAGFRPLIEEFNKIILDSKAFSQMFSVI